MKDLIILRRIFILFSGSKWIINRKPCKYQRDESVSKITYSHKATKIAKKIQIDCQMPLREKQISLLRQHHDAGSLVHQQ